MVFFEPGVDFCLKLADTHGSYQIIKALRLQGSNHSLHARLDLRCPWPCPQLGYILASQPQLGLPLVLASVVVYINGIPSESCHGLLVRDFPAVLHVEFNHPVRLRCLEIPLDSSPFKGPHSAFRPSFERLDVRPEKKLWRFMTFEFFILTQVLDSGCPICFLELTLSNF